MDVKAWRLDKCRLRPCGVSGWVVHPPLPSPSSCFLREKEHHVRNTLTHTLHTLTGNQNFINFFLPFPEFLTRLIKVTIDVWMTLSRQNSITGGCLQKQHKKLKRLIFIKHEFQIWKIQKLLSVINRVYFLCLYWVYNLLPTWQFLSDRVGGVLVILHDKVDWFGGIGLDADLHLGTWDGGSTHEGFRLDLVYAPGGGGGRRNIT